MSTLYCNKTQKLFTRLLLLAINSIKMFISLNVLHNSTKKKTFNNCLALATMHLLSEPFLLDRAI